MAPIVAPSICRFTINATYAFEEVANIVDMQIDTTGGDLSREDACFQVAGDILNNWDDHVLPGLVAPYVAQSVSWVDLNSLDGSTGERSSTSAETWPKAGGDPGQGAPGNVALRIDKIQDGGRRARNGRMYLVGIGESFQSNGANNTYNGDVLTGFNTVMGDFLEGINDAEGINLNRTQKMVVVHTVDGAFASYSDVTALVAQPTVASQRRRLPW